MGSAPSSVSGRTRRHRASSPRERTEFPPVPGELEVATRDKPNTSAEADIAAPFPHLNPLWIDLHLVRGWIETCIREHAECQPPEHLTERPIWLIDVSQQCIVPDGSDIKYLAMSYVWGNVPSLQTTRNNVQDLQVPGVLSKAENRLQIPKTIRHVMALTEALGQRYLWVDQLCICQDDEDGKHAQLAAMGSIYANAVVTIVAATGWDADHGLRGLEGISEPRNLGRGRIEDTEEYRNSLAVGDSIWASRGWTFQENILSTRKVIFNYKTVIWDCRHGSCHEAKPSEWARSAEGRSTSFNDLSSPSRRPTANPTCTELNDLYSLINGYNIRDLTYPEDAIRAFSGITSSLRITFARGFLWGLPLDLFQQALFWINIEPLQRRLARDAASEGLPSWSWVGWRGTIYSGSLATPTYFATMRVRPSKHMPTLDAFKSQFDFLQERVKHGKPLCDWQYTDLSAPLRTARRSVSESQHPSRVGRYLFATNVEMGRVSITLSSAAYREGPGGAIAWEVYGVNGPEPTNPYVSNGVLYSTEDGLTGQLLRARREAADYQARTHQPVALVVAECLAISLCRKSPQEVYHRLDAGPPRPEIVSKYRDYYNVIWIQRNGDIAWRRGVGYVEKSIWKSIGGKRRIDVKLG